MEIYIKESEMPKSCSECRALMLIGGDYCSLLKQNIDIDTNCPLKSLENHDKEVREQAIKEFAKKYDNKLKELYKTVLDEWEESGGDEWVIRLDYIALCGHLLDEIVLEEMTK